MIAATLSDMHSAITGAIGALKGPLHGGANEATMKLLFAIDKAGADPVEYVRGMFAQQGEDLRLRASRVPHRRSARDAPAAHVRGAGQGRWQYEVVRHVAEDRGVREGREEAERECRLLLGVSTYTTLGIDIDLFTPIFAVSRISGWAAHVIEQHDDNRLIRPRADYTGPEYPAPYTPIAER